VQLIKKYNYAELKRKEGDGRLYLMIGVYKGRPAIMDFKQTNRPKKREWIQDYLMQLAAYAQAHNALFNTEIEQGVVLMCSRDLTFQRFELTGEKFTRASDAFMKKLDLYNESII
jgi:rRNA maturation protein Rpf1